MPKAKAQATKRTKKEFLLTLSARPVKAYAFEIDEMPGRAFVGTTPLKAEQAMHAEAARVFGEKYENIHILLDTESET